MLKKGLYVIFNFFNFLIDLVCELTVFSTLTSKLPALTNRLPLEVVGAFARTISSKVLNSYNEISTS